MLHGNITLLLTNCLDEMSAYTQSRMILARLTWVLPPAFSWMTVPEIAQLTAKLLKNELQILQSPTAISSCKKETGRSRENPKLMTYLNRSGLKRSTSAHTCWLFSSENFLKTKTLMVKFLSKATKFSQLRISWTQKSSSCLQSNPQRTQNFQANAQYISVYSIIELTQELNGKDILFVLILKGYRKPGQLSGLIPF